MRRREFIGLTGGFAAAVAGGGAMAGRSFKTTLRKASIMGRPTAKGLDQVKAAGFDGIECRAWNVKPEEAAASRELAEARGLKIHSVMRAWINLNHSDQAKVDAELASVETALRAAKGYGADAILLVPCRIGGMPMPQPWEFDVRFAPETCLVTQVVKGDNAPYQAYIDAQNHATTSSQQQLRKILPTAAETGVAVALENVWNNLWVSPEHFAAFVRSYGSPWVRAYFDIGNHVKYALPQHWIRALGGSIAKCHVKDFKLNDNGHGGKWADIRDGSIDWPLVRAELDRVGYNGWLTVEGSGGLSLTERAKRLDLIIGGA